MGDRFSGDWVYLAVILDLFSRRVVGWAINWQTRREVEVALFGYINGFYNPRRLHSAIGWQSTVAIEQNAA